MNRIGPWLERYAIKLVAVLVVASLAVAGLTIWLTLRDHDRLRGVNLAGPCRAVGIKNPECRQQSRLIIAACADQPQTCARLYGIRVVRVTP